MKRSTATKAVTFPLLEHVGRLGNQLFQLAGTLGVARARGLEPRFPTQWSYRPYFSVPDEYFSDQPGLPAPELLLEMDPRARVYMQDLTLWQEVQEEVAVWLQPSALAWRLLKEIPLHGQLAGAISVHIRRGDQAASGLYWVPSTTYVLDALAQVPRAPVVVFSDDPAWCETELLPKLTKWSVTLYRGVPREAPAYWTAPVLDWIDLFLQAEADRHIISNSTYSWWGAWLSGDQAVLYPSVWYGPTITWMALDRMIPATWRKVDVT